MEDKEKTPKGKEVTFDMISVSQANKRLPQQLPKRISFFLLLFFLMDSLS